MTLYELSAKIIIIADVCFYFCHKGCSRIMFVVVVGKFSIALQIKLFNQT